VSKGEYNSSKVLVHLALACLLVRKYIQEKRNIRMKEIDQMLDQWIHNSIIRAKLRKLITNQIRMKTDNINE
jgi:hypothetical protein